MAPAAINLLNIMPKPGYLTRIQLHEIMVQPELQMNQNAPNGAVPFAPLTAERGGGDARALLRDWMADPANLDVLAPVTGGPLGEPAEPLLEPRSDLHVYRHNETANRLVLFHANAKPFNDQLLTHSVTLSSTYSSIAVVWITSQTNADDLGALAWLNDITREYIEFYALEVSWWRIAGSAPAPVFRVIGKPDARQSIPAIIPDGFPLRGNVFRDNHYTPPSRPEPVPAQDAITRLSDRAKQSFLNDATDVERAERPAAPRRQAFSRPAKPAARRTASTPQPRVAKEKSREGKSLASKSPKSKPRSRVYFSQPADQSAHQGSGNLETPIDVTLHVTAPPVIKAEKQASPTTDKQKRDAIEAIQTPEIDYTPASSTNGFATLFRKLMGSFRQQRFSGDATLADEVNSDPEQLRFESFSFEDKAGAVTSAEVEGMSASTYTGFWQGLNALVEQQIASLEPQPAFPQPTLKYPVKDSPHSVLLRLDANENKASVTLRLVGLTGKQEQKTALEAKMQFQKEKQVPLSWRREAETGDILVTLISNNLDFEADKANDIIPRKLAASLDNLLGCFEPVLRKN
jgi:hypothetical protein